MVPPAEPPRERRRPAAGPARAGVRAWIARIWHGVLVFSFLFSILVVFSAVAAVRGIRDWVARASASSADDPFEKTELKALDPAAGTPHRDAPRVLYVPLRGVIASRSGSWSAEGDSAAEALRQIRLAAADPEISGILLDLDSPGGEMTASDELHDALLRFRRSGEGRRVVARFGATAASGAFYAACAADWIVTGETTLTGSIGVKMEGLNVKQLAESNGVRAVSIVSGRNKNVMSPFEDLTDEQRQMLQKMVDSLHARFVSVVAEGRHLDEARVKPLADGRLLLGADALKEGLADQAGQLQEACEKLRSWFGGKAPRYVRYSRRESVFDLFSDPAFWGAAIREAAPSARPAGVSAPSARMGE